MGQVKKETNTGLINLSSPLCAPDFFVGFLNWEIEVSHHHPVPTVPNRLIG